MRRHLRPEALAFKIVVGVGVLAAIRVVLLPVISFDHWYIELPLEALAVVTGVGVVLILELLRARRHLEVLQPMLAADDGVHDPKFVSDWLASALLVLRKIVGIDTGQAHVPLLSWVADSLDAARQGIHDLRAGAGWRLAEESFNDLMEQFAAASNGSYVGTTGDVPSVFVERYRWVFERKSEPQMAQRFVIAEAGELARDRAENPQDYAEFIKWHADKDIELFGLSSLEFARLSRLYGVGKYVTLWDSYGILLTPEAVDGSKRLSHVTVRLVLAGEARFKKLQTYAAELDRRRIPLDAYIETASTD